MAKQVRKSDTPENYCTDIILTLYLLQTPSKDGLGREFLPRTWILVGWFDF